MHQAGNDMRTRRTAGRPKGGQKSHMINRPAQAGTRRLKALSKLGSCDGLELKPAPLASAPVVFIQDLSWAAGGISHAQVSL